MTNFKNIITINGFLQDLAYSDNKELIGVIRQTKQDINGTEQNWYFPFVCINPSKEVLEKINEAYLVQDAIAGTDLVLKQPFLNNEDYVIEVSGSLSFNALDKNFKNYYEQLKTQIKDEGLEILTKFYQLALAKSQERFIYVIDNKIRIMKLNKQTN